MEAVWRVVCNNVTGKHGSVACAMHSSLPFADSTVCIWHWLWHPIRCPSERKSLHLNKYRGHRTSYVCTDVHISFIIHCSCIRLSMRRSPFKHSNTMNENLEHTNNAWRPSASGSYWKCTEHALGDGRFPLHSTWYNSAYIVYYIFI